MKELHEQQAADELRTPNEAEIGDVSGALIINMGLFGELEFHPGGCVRECFDAGNPVKIALNQVVIGVFSPKYLPTT